MVTTKVCFMTQALWNFFDMQLTQIRGVKGPPKKDQRGCKPGYRQSLFYAIDYLNASRQCASVDAEHY